MEHTWRSHGAHAAHTWRTHGGHTWRSRGAAEHTGTVGPGCAHAMHTHMRHAHAMHTHMRHAHAMYTHMRQAHAMHTPRTERGSSMTCYHSP